MNIIERGRDFVQKVRELAGRSAWEWRRCPRCGKSWTRKNGGRFRYPWTLEGRQRVRIQRHWCYTCQRTYSEEQAWLVAGSWYARAVQRCAVDKWMHERSSLRRVAESLRSLLGRQERWWVWHVEKEKPQEQGACTLHHSTVQRWLDRAGQKAQESVPGQMAGLPCSGQMGTDGLWVRLRGGSKRVVLTLVDSVTGLLWGMVVVAEEEVPRVGRCFLSKRRSWVWRGKH